mgnify:CR=1 FL=1
MFVFELIDPNDIALGFRGEFEQSTKEKTFEQTKKSYEITWINCVGWIVCLSSKATESNCLVVADDEIRIEFDGLVIRIGFESRVRNDDECGDRLVLIEFGGVRCLLGLSSVIWRRNELPPERLFEFLKNEHFVAIFRSFIKINSYVGLTTRYVDWFDDKRSLSILSFK